MNRDGPFAPGDLVRHPDEPAWGVGQVQSVAGHRVTVNFEHGGKRTINAAVIALEAVVEPRHR
ncbi:MAG: DUF3553 domain-containing protein [Alphaproteobacteria bacterium]|nr:DUF3553 domain-containing protein [Alphaproteobacteria bacterium]